MKKLSDEEIISRGRAPVEEKDKPVSILAILAVGGIIGTGFAIGAIVGAGMAVAGGMGVVGFISGLATGAIWGGMSGVGLIGAACGIGALFDSRQEKKDRKRNEAYEAAMARKRAAAKEWGGASKIPEKGGAKNAFRMGKEPEADVEAAPKTALVPSLDC